LEKSHVLCGLVKIPLDKLQYEELPDNSTQFEKEEHREVVKQPGLTPKKECASGN